MRALAFLQKNFLENLREWKILSLALVFAPAFVNIMYGYYGVATPAYRLFVINHDIRDGDSSAGGAEAKALVRAWREAQHPDGNQMFTVVEQTDLEQARASVKRRDADLLVEIPAGFTDAVRGYGRDKAVPPGRLMNHADERNPRGAMALALSDYVAFTLAALSVNQVFLGLVALALAYLAALTCGYRSAGSLAVLLVVGAAATLSVVAIAVLVCAFLKSMFELLIVGSFPFFVLMFFSECMFPLPKIRVLDIGSHILYANDILPTTLCVRAFNRILSFGAGIGDVAFELGGIMALTCVYFAVGTWLFSRRHLRV